MFLSQTVFHMIVLFRDIFDEFLETKGYPMLYTRLGTSHCGVVSRVHCYLNVGLTCFSLYEFTKNLVDGTVWRQSTVEDTKLSLESLWNVIATSAWMNHSCNKLYIYDGQEVSGLVQTVHAMHLHHLTGDLISYLPQIHYVSLPAVTPIHSFFNVNLLNLG